MIARVAGEVVELGDHLAVVMVGGVGLQVSIPEPLRGRLRLQEHVLLFTQMIVRQDLLALYGFETDEDRRFFNLLMGADGVGPKMALNILSTLSVDAIRRAVSADQPEMFSRVSGVGKRTSQKIMLHLQGKVEFEGTLDATASLSNVDESVLEALTSLGYSIIEAQTALQSIPRDTPDVVEDRLRVALGYFGG